MANVNHTKEFLERHERLLKERAELKERRKQEKIERWKVRREETHQKRLERKRKRYQELKESGGEKYQQYLDQQAEYRKKRNEQKEKENDEYFNGWAKKVESLKDMRGYFYVDKEGNVYNQNRRKMFQRKHPQNGYSQLSNGKLVHRLVWEVWNGEIPKGMEIDHINCVRDDNRLENLRICTHKENCNNPISKINYSRHNKEVDRSYLKKYWAERKKK